MVTRALLLALLALLGLQRLLELRLSRRNEELLRREGAVEHVPHQYVWMRLMHLAWFLCIPLEVYLLQRPFQLPVALLALLGLAAGQVLRLTAIRTLGWRWSVRVFTLPRTPRVQRGIYRWVSHPNYLGVALELASVPMLHGAWLTALVFSLLNAVLLGYRIRAEERYLT